MSPGSGPAFLPPWTVVSSSSVTVSSDTPVRRLWSMVEVLVLVSKAPGMAMGGIGLVAWGDIIPRLGVTMVAGVGPGVLCLWLAADAARYSEFLRSGPETVERLREG